MGEEGYRINLPKIVNILNEKTVQDVYISDITCNFHGVVIKFTDGSKIHIEDEEGFSVCYTKDCISYDSYVEKP